MQINKTKIKFFLQVPVEIRYYWSAVMPNPFDAPITDNNLRACSIWFHSTHSLKFMMYLACNDLSGELTSHSLHVELFNVKHMKESEFKHSEEIASAELTVGLKITDHKSWRAGEMDFAETPQPEANTMYVPCSPFVSMIHKVLQGVPEEKCINVESDRRTCFIPGHLSDKNTRRMTDEEILDLDDNMRTNFGILYVQTNIEPVFVESNTPKAITNSSQTDNFIFTDSSASNADDVTFKQRLRHMEMWKSLGHYSQDEIRELEDNIGFLMKYLSGDRPWDSTLHNNLEIIACICSSTVSDHQVYAEMKVHLNETRGYRNLKDALKNALIDNHISVEDLMCPGGKGSTMRQIIDKFTNDINSMMSKLQIRCIEACRSREMKQREWDNYKKDDNKNYSWGANNNKQLSWK